MTKLLIVDDERIIREDLALNLPWRQHGIELVTPAGNGREAVEVIEREKPDIVLADINMPKMNGLEFCRQAKERDPAVKIAILTGYDYLDYAIRAIKIGVDDYALKPLSRNDVQKLLFRLIEKKKDAEGFAAVRRAVGQLARIAGSDSDAGIKGQLTDVLEQHLADPGFSLGVMAEQLGYSLSYLSTLFKKTFGENFRDYLQNLRLERAKILLLSTEMKNYEISAAVGIEDPNYFSVCFRRKFQKTPKEFRMGAGHGR